MEEISRSEHLTWAKGRALEYVKHGDLQQAFDSIASDLNKHPELQGHLALMLGFRLLLAGHLNTADKMREFIEGFN